MKEDDADAVALSVVFVDMLAVWSVVNFQFLNAHFSVIVTVFLCVFRFTFFFGLEFYFLRKL